MAVKDRKKRRCLRCREDFVSEHNGNRICESCTILNKSGSNFILNKAMSLFESVQTTRLRKKYMSARG